MTVRPAGDTRDHRPSWDLVRGWAGEHRVAAFAAGAGFVLAVGLLVAALVPGPDRSGDSVVVFGDSITEFGQDHLRKELGDEYELKVDGVFGACTGDRIDAAAAVAATHPDQVVVNLGTNDVVVGTPLDKVRHDIDAVLAELDSVECVHVVTVGENLISDGIPLPRSGAAVNEQIAEVVGEHPNAELLHWDRVQDAAARRRGDPQALLFDGIHPDGDGLAVLAKGYEGVLGDCGRPWMLP